MYVYIYSFMYIYIYIFTYIHSGGFMEEWGTDKRETKFIFIGKNCYTYVFMYMYIQR
jgi:hypothetical protein